MNIPVKFRVPMDVAVRVNAVLDRLRAAHDKEVAEFMKRAPLMTDPEEVAETQRDLRERSRRLTDQHLLRLCVMAGQKVLEMDTAALSIKLAKDDIVVGRPRVMEVRRGRAA